MGRETSQGLKWSLRITSGISLVIGIGFIIWALVIQSPPKSALPVGLIILGSLAIVASVIGLFNSVCARCCLNVFLFFVFLLTIGEFGIVIACFANLDGITSNLYSYLVNEGAAAAFSPPPPPPPPPPPHKAKNGRRLLQAVATTVTLTQDQVATEESIKSHIQVGRYIFLIFVIFQFIALIVTIVYRIKFPYKEDPANVEEQRHARSAMAQIQMESLKSSTTRGNKTATSPAPESGNFYTASDKMYKSVTKRMSQKYGEFTSDPAFQRKWWQSIPGFR